MAPSGKSSFTTSTMLQKIRSIKDGVKKGTLTEADYQVCLTLVKRGRICEETSPVDGFVRYVAVKGQAR